MQISFEIYTVTNNGELGISFVPLLPQYSLKSVRLKFIFHADAIRYCFYHHVKVIFF